MHITGDQFLVKKINKSIVLETIKNKSPLSRAQISEITGLNKGTVSALVNELIDEDLVYEIGPGQSSGGRRPVLLLFNKNAGHAIGVDLGVNYILAVLTNLQGEVLEERTVPLNSLAYDSVLETLKQTLRELVASAPLSTYGITGIGVGVPGIVDDQGKILFAPNLHWKDINLKAALEETFNVPVTIDNEANAGALGEKKFGAGKDVSNLIYVSAGIGIGTGIIINNELFRGAQGFSGEMGHTIIEVNGKKCRCGNRGCWELYASENALLESVRSLFLPEEREQAYGPSDLSIEDVRKWAENDDPRIINILTQVGEYLGIGLTNIINTFNPEAVIIGNRLTKLERWLANPLQRVVESRALPYHQKHLKIHFSNLGIYSSALGASSFAISHFFANTTVTVDGRSE
ncbi:xylose repressor [Bacillaceae bacterium]